MEYDKEYTRKEILETMCEVLYLMGEDSDYDSEVMKWGIGEYYKVWGGENSVWVCKELPMSPCGFEFVKGGK